MSELLSLEAAPLGLDAVLRARGFERLTAIQSAVLAPNLAGRDLRICSQTGSGKTVALGFVLAESVAAHDSPKGKSGDRTARPTALVVAPTRELATQIARELGWLYAPLRAGVVGVTGGTSVEEEQRRLARGPAVVVGTPGRILDHLRRGSLSLDALTSLVLDEADEMLDMGFEEELDAIRSHAPEERRSHLVSATFGDRVAAVADRLQRDPEWIHGTPLGAPNQDIEHVLVLVDQPFRADALVNLLLRHPDDKTLVFVRTRADAQELAAYLVAHGFSARALSGDMSHRERTKAFDEFRSGVLRVLVATDVAARGLDVADIARVIQVDLPEGAEVFTHRGGRTGRAGRRGQNVLLVAPRVRRKAEALIHEAGVDARLALPPTPEEIRVAAEERLLDAVREPLEGRDDLRALTAKLLAQHDAADVVLHLLTRVQHGGPCPPRLIPAVPLEPVRPARERAAAKAGGKRTGAENFVPFQVSWGARLGADPRRLLALVCRRGKVTRNDIGSISINRESSIVEVSRAVAEKFEDAVRRKDPRDPNVRFRRWDPSGPPPTTRTSSPPPRPRGRARERSASV